MHSWLNVTTDGGGFFFYPNGTEGPAQVVPPEFNTALVLDGSVIVHGVDIYKPGSKPPFLVPTNKNELRYTGVNDEWEVKSNNKTLGHYKTTDLRISLVWR